MGSRRSFGGLFGYPDRQSNDNWFAFVTPQGVALISGIVAVICIALLDPSQRNFTMTAPNVGMFVVLILLGSTGDLRVLLALFFMVMLAAYSQLGKGRMGRFELPLFHDSSVCSLTSTDFMAA